MFGRASQRTITKQLWEKGAHQKLLKKYLWIHFCIHSLFAHGQ